jgi:hypothetical protein
MTNKQIECGYRSLWHLLIASVGIYEMRNHRKTTFSRVLSLGLIAFHTDAAICDWLDQPTTAQRLLRRLRP